jgi:hypothetical protein
MSLSEATFVGLYSWLTRNLGFFAAWLMAAMPSLSILAILLWLGFSAHLAADVELADAETAQQLP